MQHGKGIYINIDNVRKPGLWENGQKIKWLTHEKEEA